MDLIPFIALAPLLIAAGYCDLRFMRIPDVLSLAAVALFAVYAVLQTPPDLWFRLVTALAVFLAGFTAFAFRMVGGGDVKFLSALMLFVPVGQLALFANVFSASLILGILLVVGVRRVPASARLGWKTFSGSQKFPMGVSIAAAGLAFPIVLLALD